EIKSYKQLPLNLYQIQTKYRDEKRPRFGLMRSREFIMKDAYSFDTDSENMTQAYDIMWDAYDRIFKRLKLKFKVVQGDTGAMGGKVSHEFMAISDAGEGLMAYCDSCDYAATDEKAAVVYENTNEDIKMLDIEKVHTPHARTIDSLVEFFQIDKSNFGKALVYNSNNKPLVVIIPGDRELNETKLLNHLGLAAHDIEMADQDMIQDISGAEKGFTGPIGLKEGTRLIVDARITKMRNLVVGGNETDYHIKNANYGRDFQGEIVDDLLLVEEGDKCPKCDDSLKMARGIEVGNIFQLGTKYSQGLGAKYLDENGKEQPFYMGSYGIGITRSVAAIIEQYHDDKGIVWPLNTAPYHVIITIINTKDEEQMNLGEKLYQELTALGVEVLLDDRNERAGVKFNDRDLIGIPIRITVGKRAKESIVEYSLRSSGEKIEYKESEVLDLIKDEFEKAEFKF
ncbi:MAG TPA: proline--tRNA ligase, partial [Tissierellaceae bacterium]|nr:proline--tRNA ligase [Tissierellaceae bacterium]